MHLGRMFLVLCVSVKSVCSTVLFRSSVSLVVFSLVLLITESGVLKSLPVTVLLFLPSVLCLTVEQRCNGHCNEKVF